MSNTIIELRNVWKTYEMGDSKVNALQGISLKIEKGEFLAIQGSSGSGKSTCMNMIGCLDVPSKGKVYLDGKDISRMSESELAIIRGKKIGFIFQQFNLIGTLNAMENVALPLLFQGISEEEREKRAIFLLKKVDMDSRIYHKPNELSGGQQQRVAIARSLAVDPDILLGDEPTGNLDSKTGIDVLKFLKKLHIQDGKTIVMVTHDNQLGKKAERIVYIKDGMLLKNKNG